MFLIKIQKWKALGKETGKCGVFCLLNFFSVAIDAGAKRLEIPWGPFSKRTVANL